MQLTPGDLIDVSDVNSLISNVWSASPSPAPGQVKVAHTEGAVAPRLLAWASGEVGTGLPGHTAPLVCPSSTATPATKTTIAGTVAVGGGSGVTVAAGDALRISYCLQVRPTYALSPYLSTLALIEIDKKSGGHVQVSYNGHCWLISLELATNAALTSWTTPPGMSGMASTIRTSYTGGLLSACAGMACVPAVHCFSYDADQGDLSTASAVSVRWIQAVGEWAYTVPSGTAGPYYGARLRVHGVYHMVQDTGGASALVVDTGFGGATQTLETDCGQITIEHLKL